MGGPISRRRPAAIQAFAVVRVDRTGFSVPDEHLGPSVSVHGLDFTVKEVVLTMDEAIREVERLNALAEGKRCRYLWTTTRFFPDGGSFGGGPTS